MTSPDDQLEIHFQEAHGARLFRKGTPRAILEVKSSHIPTEILLKAGIYSAIGFAISLASRFAADAADVGSGDGSAGGGFFGGSNFGLTHE